MFGAAGYSRNRPLERMVRDARMFTIGGGTAQILRTVVASRMLGRKLPQTRDGYVEGEPAAARGRVAARDLDIAEAGQRALDRADALDEPCLGGVGDARLRQCGRVDLCAGQQPQIGREMMLVQRLRVPVRRVVEKERTRAGCAGPARAVRSSPP